MAIPPLQYDFSPTGSLVAVDGEIETVPVLLLLVVDNNYDYELKCEYSNLDKWAISKMDGGTGVPTGIE